MRAIEVITDYIPNAFSSVFYCSGETKIICTASLQDQVPPWMKNEEQGWLTAEYNMLPASTKNRKARSRTKPDSRGTEIERLIGRSLRAAVNLKKIPGYTIMLDCDVINADGSTRTCSISGSYICLALLIKRALGKGLFKQNPHAAQIAAVSIGKTAGGKLISDLDYSEDVSAVFDMNFVMNDRGNFIEIQGTAEHGDFSSSDFNDALKMAQNEISLIMQKQNEVLKTGHER